MKKSILFGCLFALLMVSPSAASADFERTKIAVLDFTIQGKGDETEDMGGIVAEWLITAFVKEGRFDVIERRLLKKILGEQELGASGVLEQDSVSQLGKLLGVKVVISGSVMRFQNIIEVNARIIDVESASIIAAESVKDTSAIGLEKLVISMAQKIIKDFPLEGYIVHRAGDVVSIDLGKRVGVKRKMQFVAYKEGAVIKHPTTGEILDVETIETGVIEISKAGSKVSKAIIIKEQSPNAIAYGQRVKSVGKEADLRLYASTPRASRPKAKPPKTAVPVAAKPKEEKVVAKIQPAPVAPRTPDSGLRAAIFPWKLGGTARIYLADTTDALKRIILKDELFVPLFSYYDLGNKVERKYDVRKLPQEILRDNVVETLWIKKGFFSGWTPNVKLVSTLGRQLQVDVILMYYIDVTAQDPDPGTVVSFLIDANTQKIYRAKSGTQNFEQDGGRINYTLTQKVFKAYNR